MRHAFFLKTLLHRTLTASTLATVLLFSTTAGGFTESKKINRTPGQTILFLDTDIGSDVDDVMALYTILGSDRYQLVGVSTVNGDVVSRSKIARLALNLLDRTDIPIGTGIGSTLLRRKQPRDWSKQLKDNLKYYTSLPTPNKKPIHGVDLMIQKIHENPGLTIAAIGPLTNVAMAIIKDPSIIPEIGNLMVVGGAIGLPPTQEGGSIFVGYKSEYNFNSDPDAAQLVFESNVPITMSGLTPALQVRVKRSQVIQWKQIKTTQAQWLSNQVLNRLNQHHTDATHLGDVMGVIIAAHPEAGKTHTLPLHLEIWGDTLRTVIDPTGTGRPVNVVLSAKQKPFHQIFSAAMQRSLTEKSGTSGKSKSRHQ